MPLISHEKHYFHAEIAAVYVQKQPSTPHAFIRASTLLVGPCFPFMPKHMPLLPCIQLRLFIIC